MATDVITIGPLLNASSSKFGAATVLLTDPIPTAPTDTYGRAKILKQIDFTINSVQVNFDRFPTDQYDYASLAVRALIKIGSYFFGSSEYYFDEAVSIDAGQSSSYPEHFINQNQFNLSAVHMGVISDSLNSFVGGSFSISIVFSNYLTYTNYESGIPLTLAATIVVSDPTNVTYIWEELPPPPGAFTQNAPAVVNNNAVNLTWAASAYADEYEVYRATGTHASTATGTWAKLATVSGLSYLDAAVSIGETYSYYIKSKNAYGTATSDFETIITAPPSGFTQLEITPVTGADSIRMEWTASENADFYKVYRADGYLTDPLTGTWVEKVQTTNLYWVDTTVQLGETYSYYIKAYNDSLTTDSNAQQILVDKQQQQLL